MVLLTTIHVHLLKIDIFYQICLENVQFDHSSASWCFAKSKCVLLKLKSIFVPEIDTNHFYDMSWQPKTSSNKIDKAKKKHQSSEQNASVIFYDTWDSFAWYEIASHGYVDSFYQAISDGGFAHSRIECFISMWGHKKQTLYDVDKNSNIVCSSIHWL